MHPRQSCGRPSRPTSTDRGGPGRDPKAVPLDLSAEQISLLRSDLFGALAGVLEDLQRPERLRDPVVSAGEGATFLRLLEALDERQISLPDEEARTQVGWMVETHDAANDYAPTIEAHDAQQALLDLLGGSDPKAECTR